MIDVPDFEALYREEPDPWQVGSSFYERRKLGLVLAALSHSRYHRAWDPGCGTGHLVAELADRCDEVFGSDLAATAIGIAEQTCAGLANVTLQQWSFPTDGAPPAAPFDLIVLSEFLYYLPESERAQIVDLVSSAGTPGVEVLAVHWRHQAEDAWLSGAAVQRELAGALAARGFRLQYRIEDVEFDLAGWRLEPDSAEENP